jgi:hypothetical protein
MFGYWHAPMEAQDLDEDSIYFKQVILFKRLWNPSLPLIFAMEGNNRWHFKVVCQVHKFGL